MATNDKCVTIHPYFEIKEGDGHMKPGLAGHTDNGKAAKPIINYSGLTSFPFAKNPDGYLPLRDCECRKMEQLIQ